jgi:hypothetical protein
MEITPLDQTIAEARAFRQQLVREHAAHGRQHSVLVRNNAARRAKRNFEQLTFHPRGWVATQYPRLEHGDILW